MIIKINIYSPENTINLAINSDKDLAEYNGIKLNRNFETEINKLIDIFSTWKKDNGKSIILDSENAEVEVIDSNESKKIKFSENYPENYEEFKLVLKEIIKCF